MAMRTWTKFLNGYHSTSTNTQNTTTPTLLTSYTTIIHHCQDALHAKLSNTYFQTTNTTTYTYLLAPSSTPTHRGFPDYFLNGQTDCTVALVFFPITNLTHINAPSAHPLDPITTVTECGTAKPIRDLFFEVWQQPFKQTVIDWWQHATKGERRNYIRTLIPNSLSNALRGIPADTPYFHNLQNLKTAFKYRRK